MTDRENVIKGLEVIFEKTADMFYRSTIQDALVLLKTQKPEDALKAQEPVKPKKNDVEIAGLRTWDWACPECNCILTYRANYCSCCGRAVKWE